MGSRIGVRPGELWQELVRAAARPSASSESHGRENTEDAMTPLRVEQVHDGARCDTCEPTIDHRCLIVR